MKKKGSYSEYSKLDLDKMNGLSLKVLLIKDKLMTHIGAIISILGILFLSIFISLKIALLIVLGYNFLMILFLTIYYSRIIKEFGRILWKK